MLKDKYRFKLSQQEATALRAQIDCLFANYGGTKDIEVKLPLAVLMEFHKRLVAALLFPAAQIKVYLKRPEALAFQVLYMGSMIETTHETMQIAHAIDTTL